MLNRIIFTLLVITSLNNVYAGNITPPDSTSNITDRAQALLIIDDGKTLFLEGKVRDALIRFRQAAVKDPYTWRAPYWIAQCHYKMNNYGYALQYANEAIKLNKEEVDEEVYELLGKSYHRMGKLDSAMINYSIAKEKISQMRSKELSLDLRIEQVQFAEKELRAGNSSKRVLMKGDINSGYNDYNPVLTDNGKELYFASRRSDTKGGNMNPDDQEFFEDVYRAVWNVETEQWDSVSNELGRVNSDGFDAITYISKNGMYGLMTINLTATAQKKSTKGSDIFEIEMSTKGKWNAPKRIKNKTINTTFFEGSATVTDDGNTMYFASDRKGDKSSMDIYMVEKVGKTWGEAKMLPMGLNTQGYETTPSISGDGRYLFYSSDGLKNGMGGLDVYVVENLGGGQWGTPVNLGAMVNTVSNDTHFKYYPDLKRAVMVSFELIGQKASLDLYDVDMNEFKFPGK
jgi:tetratricopeptide (TPR) repeat protein